MPASMAEAEVVCRIWPKKMNVDFERCNEFTGEFANISRIRKNADVYEDVRIGRPNHAVEDQREETCSVCRRRRYIRSRITGTPDPNATGWEPVIFESAERVLGARRRSRSELPDPRRQYCQASTDRTCSANWQKMEAMFQSYS